MTLLGRETPQLPPDIAFSNIELQVLNAYAKKKVSPRLQPCVMRYGSSPAWAATWAARKILSPATN
jgi:hypothetical protein